VVTSSQHVYEVRPRKDHRGVDLISDALPFGRLWYAESNAVSNAIGYAQFYSRSHAAVIRVYVIETHEHTGDFKVWVSFALVSGNFGLLVSPGPDNDTLMLSFYRDPLPEKSRNRRNKLSSNRS
jgi:hypothetical protein